MSRSALWRQEGAKQEREKQAEELFMLAVEEGRRNRSKNLLPLWGPDDSFHFNPMLLEKIIKSPYFQKCCQDLTDWNALVDEVYYQVKHLEPWALGSTKEPSTAFCLLLRLLTLRCTEKQMKLLLDHPDSPYIRGIGFLYLRYVGDPKTVWDWIEPYLYDTEPLTVTATANKVSHGNRRQRDPQTVGDFVKRLFSSERDFYGTMLPRLPIQIERDLQVKLLLAEQIQDRTDKHLANRKTMDYFQTLGSRVMALYGDDENPVQWYEAVIDRVITRNEDTSQPLTAPKFVVTFPQYGNTETVSLGELEMCGVALDGDTLKTKSMASFRGGSDGLEGRHRHEVEDGDRDRNWNDDYSRDKIHNKSHHNHRGYHNRGYREDSLPNRGYNRSTDHARGGRNVSPNASSFRGSAAAAQSLATERDLYEEVRRRERNSVMSSGNHATARRTPSTSARFEARPFKDTDRRGSSHPPDIPLTSDDKVESNPFDVHAPPAKKRSAEEFAAIQEKKRKLIAKYG